MGRHYQQSSWKRGAGSLPGTPLCKACALTPLTTFPEFPPFLDDISLGEVDLVSSTKGLPFSARIDFSQLNVPNEGLRACLVLGSLVAAAGRAVRRREPPAADSAGPGCCISRSDVLLDRASGLRVEITSWLPCSLCRPRSGRGGTVYSKLVG